MLENHHVRPSSNNRPEGAISDNTLNSVLLFFVLQFGLDLLADTVAVSFDRLQIGTLGPPQKHPQDIFSSGHRM